MNAGMDKPLIFQKDRSFFNCFDYLVSLFLSKHKLPYQYLFSSNWSFHYDAADAFSLAEGTKDEFPLQMKLQELYGSTETILKYDNLDDLLEKESDYIFTLADGWYLPWTVNYLREHGSHWFLIADYSSTRLQVYVKDWYREYSGWEGILAINTGFIHGGTVSYKLSKPSLNMDIKQVRGLLSTSYENIIGTHSKNGINGLNAYKSDIVNLKGDSLGYISNWWEMLSEIINMRNKYLEFICFLAYSDDSLLKDKIDITLVQAFEKTLNRWMSFRNGLMKANMTQTFDYDKTMERLNALIECEENCAKALEHYKF